MRVIPNTLLLHFYRSDYEMGKYVVWLRGQTTAVTIKWQIVNSYIRHRKVIWRGVSNFNLKNPLHNLTGKPFTVPMATWIGPISSHLFTSASSYFPQFARLKPFQWTSDYVFNIYCPFAAAYPSFANTCHASHFSQMFEDVRAELKR